MRGEFPPDSHVAAQPPTQRYEQIGFCSTGLKAATGTEMWWFGCCLAARLSVRSKMRSSRPRQRMPAVSGMTLRAWKMLALGSVVVAGLGGFVATQGRSSSSTKTVASWGLYSSEQWDAVTASFARRGFARGSVRVVTGTKLANGQPFALVGGSNASRTCFAVARGRAIGVTTCSFSKPVTIFSAPDRCAACSPGRPPIRTRSILALVRANVTVTMVHHGRESGVGIVPAGKGFAFNSSFVWSGDRLRARDANGRVLANITFTQLSSS